MSGLPPMIPQFTRFHAIVNARPQTDGPPVLHEPPSYGTWNVRFEGEKRSRDPSEPGPSKPRKAPKRTAEEDAESKREPTVRYPDANGLLTALKERFEADPHVDFAGVFEFVDNGVTHKERVQLFAHEIWKTTGYRFTVKDHPQFSNGHKTRFWCSQDEAHRSKSSKAARKLQGNSYKPRVTSGGEAIAKTRFPCQSRLLVSSRDSKTPGLRSVTVRMHHHLNHEPYVDASLPPDVVQNIWDGYGSAGYPASQVLSTYGSTSKNEDESTSTSNLQADENEESSESESASSEERFDDPPPAQVEDQTTLEPSSASPFLVNVNHTQNQISPQSLLTPQREHHPPHQQQQQQRLQLQHHQLQHQQIQHHQQPQHQQHQQPLQQHQQTLPHKQTPQHQQPTHQQQPQLQQHPHPQPQQHQQPYQHQQAPQHQQSQLHQQQQQQLQRPPQHPQLPPVSENYRNRMKAHIKNLRDFCEGLEYQLQFNDYRMLDILEREGGHFLGLVADCLKKEGRSIANEHQPMSASSSQQQLPIPMNAIPSQHQLPQVSINGPSSQHSSMSISNGPQRSPITITNTSSQHTSIPIATAPSQPQHPPGYMPLHLISDAPMDTHQHRSSAYDVNHGINPQALGYRP
ncbi:hypothetical protein CPC08DRAFT_763693 [Agrocybe pediades]|nr:hypothetical protein CPC08DRAFT_763693 [Agrocybe pediades]